jgi:hypothetical protein
VDSDEVFLRLEAFFVRGGRRDEGGAAEGFIGGIDLERGLGFRADSDRRARRDAVRGEESGPSLEKILIGRARMSAREGGEKCTGSETKRVGSWAGLAAGPKRFPVAFFYIFWFFSFSFLFFLFVS